jgi:hypothetical protein
LLSMKSIILSAKCLMSVLAIRPRADPATSSGKPVF